MEEKIKLIKTISDFAKDQMGLVSSFEPWKLFNETEKYCLYASKKNLVESPKGFGFSNGKITRPYELFGTDIKEAKKRESELKRNGFDTLLYSAKATRGGLSKDVLKYSPEIISKLVLHESFHNYINENKIKIAYDFEESFAELFEFLGTIEFSKKYGCLDIQRLIKIENEIENVSKLVIEGLNSFNEIKDKEKYFKNFRKKLDKIIWTHYQRQRFNYEINGAFFIRYKDYYQRYLEIKEKSKNFKSPKDLAKTFINQIYSNLI